MQCFQCAPLRHRRAVRAAAATATEDPASGAATTTTTSPSATTTVSNTENFCAGFSRSLGGKLIQAAVPPSHANIAHVSCASSSLPFAGRTQAVVAPPTSTEKASCVPNYLPTFVRVRQPGTCALFRLVSDRASPLRLPRPPKRNRCVHAFKKKQNGSPLL